MLGILGTFGLAITCVLAGMALGLVFAAAYAASVLRLAADYSAACARLTKPSASPYLQRQ